MNNAHDIDKAIADKLAGWRPEPSDEQGAAILDAIRASDKPLPRPIFGLNLLTLTVGLGLLAGVAGWFYFTASPAKQQLQPTSTLIAEPTASASEVVAPRASDNVATTSDLAGDAVSEAQASRNQDVANRSATPSVGSAHGSQHNAAARVESRSTIAKSNTQSVVNQSFSASQNTFTLPAAGQQIASLTVNALSSNGGSQNHNTANNLSSGQMALVAASAQVTGVALNGGTSQLSSVHTQLGANAPASANSAANAPIQQFDAQTALAPFATQTVQMLSVQATESLSARQAKTAKPIKCTTKPFALDKHTRLIRYADAGKFGDLQFLEGYAGARYAASMLTSTKVEHNDHLAQRRATERPDLGWELGARYTKVFNRFWVVAAGVQLGQNTTVFHYDDLAVVQKAPPASGGTDSIYMTGMVRYRQVYHRQHTLDIPLSVGMELRKGLRGVRVSAGTEINLGTKARGGMMFSPTGERINITPDVAQAAYRPSVGARMFASAQWFRSFNGRDRLFVEPQLTYQPFSSTRKDAPLEQRFLIGSVRLGYSVGL